MRRISRALPGFGGVVSLLVIIVGQIMQAAENATDGTLETNRAADSYERFLLANRGDPVRGERLFAEHKDLACHKCHRVTGLERSGPNLDGVGDKFSRRELARQIL